jgi:hypothetical protein
MSNSTDDRLDRIIALLSLAFASEIESAAKAVRSSPVADAILNASEEWIEPGALKANVAKSCKVSGRTIERKISELTSMGLLVAQGATSKRQLKNAGII